MMTRTITITAAQVERFARSWPCSYLPEDVGLTGEFAPNGDLIGYAWSDGSDYFDAECSGAMVALLNDARDGVL
jgi:hypothetical protein